MLPRPGAILKGAMILRKLKNVIAIALMTALLLLPVRAAETQVPTEPPVISAVQPMEVLPGNWSPLSEDTPEKVFLRDLTTAAMYRFDGDGALESDLAAAPVDVTAEYVGTYGVPSFAARGYAFRIDLNEAACWEDGTPITAEDFLFSLERLMEKGRDYSWIANVTAYQSGQEKVTDNVISLRDAGFSGVEAAKEAGYTLFYVDIEHFWGLDAGWRAIDDRHRIRDYAVPSGLNEQYVTATYLYENYLKDGAVNDHFQQEFVGISAEPEIKYTFSDIGFLITGELQLTVVLEEPMTASALALELSDFFLFRESMWSDRYGTAPEDYCGYGPWSILTSGAEEIILERNPNWWGEAAGGDFDRILCRKIGP